MICTYCSDDHSYDYICPQTPIAVAEMMRAHPDMFVEPKVKLSDADKLSAIKKFCGDDYRRTALDVLDFIAGMK